MRRHSATIDMPMHEDSERVIRISQGDRVALGELFDRYSPQVYGYLFHALRNQVEAEDILQETFIHVWKQAKNFDPERGSVPGWIAMMARYKLLDHLRRRQLRATDPNDFPELAQESSPSINLENRETSQKIRQAMSFLPDEQRKAIELAFFGSRTYEQVAIELGLPLGTVKTRIRLGFNRLRQLLRSVAEEQS